MASSKKKLLKESRTDKETSCKRKPLEVAGKIFEENILRLFFFSQTYRRLILISLYWYAATAAPSPKSFISMALHIKEKQSLLLLTISSTQRIGYNN